MMICPQCNATYTDDFLFCLADGNSLRDDSGETSTVVSHTSFSPDIEPTEAMTICVGCGHANRANSRFCKKCGKALSAVMPETVFSSAPPPRPFAQQPQFTPPVFTPPTPSGQQFHAQRNSGNQTMLIVAGALAVLVVVVGVIAYNAGNEKPANNSTSSSNTNKAANAAVNAASQAAKAANTAANAAAANEIGKIGRLNTNLNIRSAPNKTSEILGTHYEGAKLRIMDFESFTSDDGEYVKWYKVAVIENGYDSKTGNGKGNNWERYGNFGWMEAQHEGWMNAKYIMLD